MNNLKIAASFLFLMLTHLTSFGQYVLPDYQSQTVNKNKLLLRWEPRDLTEWNASIQDGYEVKIYMGTSKNNLLLKQSKIIKPATESEWDIAINKQKGTSLEEFYAGSKRLLYMEEEVQKEIMKTLRAKPGKSKEESVEDFKLSFLLYSSTYDMEIIELSGLGLGIDIEKGYVYRVEVAAANSDVHEFYFDPSQKKDLSVPKMDAAFGNKKVTLKWSTPEYKKHFFGFNLAISPNGKSYKNINETPYINILDTITTNDAAQYLTEEIALERNYKDYWFRLKGMNYFGLESTLSSIQKGYGFEGVNVMPIINHSDQTEDNHAEIKWTVDRTHNRLIKHFAVFRADERDGKYEIVMDSLPSETRMVRVPMKDPRNFYSIALIPKDGPATRSFPVFVMGQDTVAPIVPQNFTGIIDSMGIATFTWDRNTEEDLWGYKVFRSEYIEDEFGPLHPSPIQDTSYVDSVNLHSVNEKIHYTIIALDKRNNRSAFASIISLERPDTIAPSSPMIKTVHLSNDTIKVKWSASPSDDVKLHQLFRKEYQENGWELIAEYNTAEKLNYFLDTNYEGNKIYAYTVVAIDKSDLSSPPSRAMKVQTTPKQVIKNAFSSFDINFNEEKKSSSIRWNLEEETDLEEIIIYRGKSKADISMYKIVEPGEEQIVQDFEDSQQWFFVFKPITNDGSFAKLSDVILVEKPN